jgi:peptidoglycan/LPS O-acetylase OafA/YrhL
MARTRKPLAAAGLALFDHYRKPRVLGLDLLRITASLSIILTHGNAVGALGSNWVASIVSDEGYLAVDLFFVLSGWLLTRQILRMRGSFKTTLGLATRFWIRRWARTIPPYWVVLLAIYFLGPWRLNWSALPPPLELWRGPAGVSSPGYLLTHAAFLQTIFPPNMFSVSWSLVTEEWFYLLLPFVILVASRVRSWRWLIGLALGGLVLPTVIRTLLLLSSSDWGAIRAQPIGRFEGLVVGAILAAASVALPSWQTRILPLRHWLFWLSCPVIVVLLAVGTNDTFWFHSLGLLAFNVGVGLLIPFLSQLRWSISAPALAVIGTAFLSELTYPLYLLHSIVPRVAWVQVHGPARDLYAGASLFILFGLATVLHLGIERPFLALRDRGAARGRDRWKEPAAGVHPPVVPQPSLVLGASPAAAIQRAGQA